MDLRIEKKSDVYISLIGETSLLYELQDVFTFFADGYKYHPKVRAKIWDGKIRLLKLISKNKGELYYGLIEEVIKFCKSRDYTFELSDDLKIKNIPHTEELEQYTKSINICSKGEPIELRDYQIKGFVDSIQRKRCLLLSPTSSGKSAVIYTISRYLLEQNKRGLIIVPNVTLIHQLHNDFIDYSSLNGWSTDDFVHKIFAGQDKNSSKQLHLSTWQSLMTIKEQSHFEKYDFVIIDEAHGIKGTELTKILEKSIYADHRIGLTGTTDNVKANINTIIGLTGPINRLTTTKTLMERNEVANLNIKCLVLKYDEEIKKVFAKKKIKYQDEIKYLVSNTKRNNFIKNLAFSLNSNTIILTHLVESHGQILYDLLLSSKHKKDRNVYFIHGGIDSKEREQVRQIMETESNAIIVASVQTMGTGVSIKNLHNIIFATNGKSSIRVLQSIGRVLRLHHSKDSATVFDIVDDISHKKSKNFTLQHFLERVKYYNAEQFNFTIKNIEFKNE